MARNSPNPIDVHVGSRVRLRRMLVGMSQQKLGDLLGLTFQQVQKYEKGANRIGASRLYRISQILGVSVQFFFDDISNDLEAGLPETSGANGASGFSEAPAAPGPGPSGKGAQVMDFVSSAEGLQLNRSFTRIGRPAVRRQLLELVKSLSED